MSDMRYVKPDDVETQMFDWGTLKWTSEPRVTDAQKFSMGIVILNPGKGHDRHNHPGVEEVLYVISGVGEQTVDTHDDGKPFAIEAGDTIHIPADVFHSTVNKGWEPLRLVAIYSPHGPEKILRDLPDCKIIPAGEIPE